MLKNRPCIKGGSGNRGHKGVIQRHKNNPLLKNNNNKAIQMNYTRKEKTLPFNKMKFSVCTKYKKSSKVG